MKVEYRYELILYWSEEDQAFIAEVPELAGCAADGATYAEAVANAEVVIREWIETALNSDAQCRSRRGGCSTPDFRVPRARCCGWPTGYPRGAAEGGISRTETE